MKIIKNEEKVERFQQGGQMAPVNPQEQPVQDPIVELLQVAAQALQNQDCQAAMVVCEGLLMIAQQQQQPEMVPVGEPQGEPVFKKGGKIVKRMKKGCKK